MMKLFLSLTALFMAGIRAYAAVGELGSDEEPYKVSVWDAIFGKFDIYTGIFLGVFIAVGVGIAYVLHKR
ncbi:hypothetical protein AGMMS49982_17740 [Bacteroidia bacterium]|nr:hypothetical protein AGMMS49982_17740 [Bacteroidia bacterium]